MTLPAIDDFDSLGGAKKDYSASVTDANYDRSAAEVNPTFANVSCTTRMLSRAKVAFTVSGGVCTVARHQAVWLTAATSTALTPAVTQTGTGVFHVSFPATVSDPLDVSHSLNLQDGMVNVSGSTAYISNATRTSPHEFDVRVWDAAGNLTNPSFTEVITLKVDY